MSPLYSSAGDYWFGWITYLLLLAPTFLLNLLTCVLIAASPILRKHPNSLLVAFLALEDALLSLFCLVQCAVNLSEMSIAWAASGCQLQAIYVTFCVLASGYTLCAIAWHNDRRIRGKEGFGIPDGQPSSARKSFSRLLRFHAVSWTWSALVTFLCTSGVATPGESPIRVMPSGTYCFIALQELVPSLLFYLPGVCMIGVFLLMRYGQIYYYIYRSWSHTTGQVAPLDGVKSIGEKSMGEEQELTIKISMMLTTEDNNKTHGDPQKPPAPQLPFIPLTPRSTEEEISRQKPSLESKEQQQPQKHLHAQLPPMAALPEESIQRRIRAARKMFIFVCVFLLCSAPILGVSTYEMAANSIAPGYVYLVAGYLVHVNSLLNPVLYFWTNKKAIEEIRGYWRGLF